MTATQARFYSNTAVAGQIGNTGGISNSATSFFLSSTPSGYPSQFPFLLVLSPNGTINAGQAPEAVLVTAGSGTSGSPWTITRGQDGTTAASWGQNATVTHEVDSGDFTQFSLHANSSVSPNNDDPTYGLPHNLPASAWVTASFAAINETTLSSAQPSVTWSSIPGTYKHLLIIVQARLSETTVQSDDLALNINGDAGANYSYLTISATNISGAGTGSLVQSQFTASAVTSWPLLRVAASEAGAAANAGGGFALIPNYTSTVFNKSFYALSGMGDGTSAAIDGRLRWGFYNPGSQVAVTSLTVSAPGSSNMNVGSFLGLYGIA